MEKVIVTKMLVGICHMQVCVLRDATDDEILIVCNRENPSGTTNGWTNVVRTINEDDFFDSPNMLPVQCTDYPERVHLLVAC